MKTTQPTIATYTVRSYDGVPAVRFEIEAALVGTSMRVTVLLDGNVWCEDSSVSDACASVNYLTIPKSRRATLRAKIEQAAFAAALAA